MKHENVQSIGKTAARRVAIWSLFTGVVLLVGFATIVAHNWSFGPLSVLERDVRNALHAPGFVVVTLILLSCLKLTRATRFAYVLTFLVTGALAVVAEGSQFFGLRDASMHDLLQDSLGIGTGLMVGACLFREFQSWPQLKLIGIAAAVILSLFVSWPLIDASYAVVAQRKALPQLAGFEARWERRLYAGSFRRGLKLLPTQGTEFGHGTRIARMSFRQPAEPGLELFPYQNWEGHQYLAFDVLSASKRPVSFTLRVHDITHNNEHDDRFNSEYIAGPDPKTLRIPLTEIAQGAANRRIDLSHIAALIFFISDPAGDEKIYIDNIRLE